MEWCDQGLVLSARKHGETSVIASILTPHQGRHMGLVRGGQSRRRQGLLQPGNVVDAVWRARLADHLGSYTLEPVHDYFALVLDDPLRLKGLSAALGLLHGTLAERDPHPGIYQATLSFLEHLVSMTDDGAEGRSWVAVYVHWELELLDCLGFGLDLSACAATGAVDELIYVSPRTGRAVSAAAGAPYRGKLLALPGFMLDPSSAPDKDDLIAGLRLTGYFLDRHHYAAEGRTIPAARTRLIEALWN
ncbi:MAG: DNA repair protein RecO [Alphaproteobacteria bacterium]|nr:DNA repair protein RecO [Alphaproteobacteria bacterium]